MHMLNNHFAFNEEEEEEAYLECISRLLKAIIIEVRADVRRANSNRGYHMPPRHPLYDDHTANPPPPLHEACRSELSHHHHHHHHHYYYNQCLIIEMWQ